MTCKSIVISCITNFSNSAKTFYVFFLDFFPKSEKFSINSGSFTDTIEITSSVYYLCRRKFVNWNPHLTWNTLWMWLYIFYIVFMKRECVFKKCAECIYCMYKDALSQLSYYKEMSPWYTDKEIKCIFM